MTYSYARDFNSLGHNNLQIFKADLKHFLASIEKYRVSDTYKDEQFSSLDRVRGYYLKLESSVSAYAASGDICFFGGWPSKIINNTCKRPWLLKDDKELKKFGVTYNEDFACNKRDHFRCFPTLFSNPNDDKGVCVDTKGSYKGLTKKCEQASTKRADYLQDKESFGQLRRYQKAIFGDDGNISSKAVSDYGFCDNLQDTQPDVRKACVILDKRISEIFKLKDKNESSLKNQLENRDKRSRNRTLAIFEQCKDYLKNRSSDDIYGRKLIESLASGIVTCQKAKPGIVDIDFENLESVFNITQKQLALGLLNLNSFKRNLEALILLELIYRPSEDKKIEERLNVEDKSFFKNKIFDQLQSLKNNENKELYEKAFDEVYDEVFRQRDQISEINYSKAVAGFDVLAGKIPKVHPRRAQRIRNKNKQAPLYNGSINQLCRKINYDYHQKFKDKILSPSFKMARSHEENKFLAEKRDQITQRVSQLFTQSQIGFLLGTKTFQRHVLDPGIDYAETCARQKHNMIRKPSEKIYNKALVDARKRLLKAFKSLDNKNMLTSENDSDEDFLDHNLKKYLKDNPSAVLNTLLQMSKEQRNTYAAALCKQAGDIYDLDENVEKIGIIGGGLTAASGTILSMGGTFLCPSTFGAGCAVAVLGGKLTAIGGTTVLVGSSIYKGLASSDDYDVNDNIQLSNLREPKTIGQYLSRAQRANERIDDSISSGAGGAASAALRGIISLSESENSLELDENLVKEAQKVKKFLGVDVLLIEMGLSDKINQLRSSILNRTRSPAKRVEALNSLQEILNDYFQTKTVKYKKENIAPYILMLRRKLESLDEQRDVISYKLLEEELNLLEEIFLLLPRK